MVAQPAEAGMNELQGGPASIGRSAVDVLDGVDRSPFAFHVAGEGYALAAVVEGAAVVAHDVGHTGIRRGEGGQVFAHDDVVAGGQYRAGVERVVHTVVETVVVQLGRRGPGVEQLDVLGVVRSAERLVRSIHELVDDDLRM